jgi:hypothetical protein
LRKKFVELEIDRLEKMKLGWVCLEMETEAETGRPPLAPSLSTANYEGGDGAAICFIHFGVHVTLRVFSF